MKAKSNGPRGLVLLIVALLAVLVITQLQPVLLRASGAVDGSFGLRPTSHKCAGLTLHGDWVTARLAPADWQGNLGMFRVRWYVPEEAGGRDFCMGQDIWFGE